MIRKMIAPLLFLAVCGCSASSCNGGVPEDVMTDIMVGIFGGGFLIMLGVVVVAAFRL